MFRGLALGMWSCRLSTFGAPINRHDFPKLRPSNMKATASQPPLFSLGLRVYRDTELQLQRLPTPPLRSVAAVGLDLNV